VTPNMSLLRFAKRTLLQALDIAGLNTRIINSAWRAHRLLIICWHGVSSDDEHFWNPNLFMPLDTFRMRLQLLREMRCNVLPLGEGLAKVKNASLPPRAVCLTVDDGESSFYIRAWPMLREFGFPATLYWTTYYSTHPYAVFDPMLSYLLWKARERTLVLRNPALKCDLWTPQERSLVVTAILEFSRINAWTAEQKESFLRELARLLEIDYSEIQSKRILHLISLAEARSMVADGLDLQLHTHRHRVPLNPDAFAAEIAENSRIVCEVGAKAASHFCYPSGLFVPEFGHWLRDNGVESATTCEYGLVDRDMNPYFLPRLVDHLAIGPAEFRGCLSGITVGLRRKYRMTRTAFV
jgi:peptidoglycan/xylan/chitin deacetylase (PgdA/CDA1 family)